MSIRSVVKKNKIIYGLVVALKKLLIRVPLEDAQKIIDHYRKKNDSIYFVQIGSNNGITGDPLFTFIKKYEWKGILIEPVPYLFDQLVKNYKNNKNLSFENVAISNQSESSKFYRLKKVDNQDLPIWYDQLGSFKKEVVLKHKSSIPNIEELLIEEDVKMLSFTDLVAKHRIKKINVLHIDTEGYDFEIIKIINFNNVKIDIVLFEHKHLTDLDCETCIRLLENNGYATYKFASDTLCVSKNLQEIIKYADQMYLVNK